MRTNVYVDGFNVYYGLFANREHQLPWKWLDLNALCGRLVPQGKTINRIRYFTADVIARDHDRDQPLRQQAYLNALSTVPGLSIHKGNFLTNTKLARPVHPIPVPALTPPIAGPCVSEVRRALDDLNRVYVRNTEEKGSDVNLASHLLNDCALNDCDAVMIVSNDSDLATPLHLAKKTWGKSIIVINPQPGRPTALLRDIADEYRKLRTSILKHCQFPDSLTDSRGHVIRKPRKWARDEQHYLDHLSNQS